MFNKLTLNNFKKFRQAELSLGPFTVLLGANASGKSNLREAFRFLHGIGRGYTLPEIIGEKWIEGGVRVWNGIRGGTKELVFELANNPVPIRLICLTFYNRKRLRTLPYSTVSRVNLMPIFSALCIFPMPGA